MLLYWYLLIAVSETTELFLTGSIPYIKLDGAKVGIELERMDFDTEGCYLFQEAMEHSV
jgi:hypothetical protein